ncbi:hypothetical protein D1B31_04320 [Neobacillus notoginsengisoli]|uniref:Uncharacterized protein n=1 Tax=Neobacillus notoginsengisoli TaxID=1578198 RepID=A0A417YYH2_9BACI|nr:hypothetical protein [Neobacillus notoginsengisoli]RHW42809.1 hypothetical protein D1B31_04320 [Neobacillus notoginsengisoli]
METTLQEMLNERPGMSILQLKRALLVQQKNGYVLIDAEIATLELTQTFTYEYTLLSSAY